MMTTRTATLVAMAMAIICTTSWAQTPVERVETEQPLVALTFDDGPNPVNTPKLLALFKKTGVRATFFVNGNSLRKHPELAKRMVAEGHELGNHTSSHPDLAKLGDLEKVRKQIEETQTILAETVGKPAAVFRAPFLSHDKNVWAVLNGMPAINASRDTRDWSNKSTVESIVKAATQDTKAGDIVLMHSWPGKTIQAMPEIVKVLQAKGLKLVTVSELLAAAEKPVAPAITKSKGKRVFFTGHSFFILGGYMAKKVDLIAKAAGKEKHELVGWRYSGGGSGAVDKWWDYANHHGALVDEINKAYGKTVIKAVPLYYGQALLRAQIIDGKVPGVKKQSELYSDAMGHVSELGQRLNAYTVFAAIYGESPVGLHVPEWETSGDTVQRAQNLSLQRVAWAALKAVPVTRKKRK